MLSLCQKISILKAAEEEGLGFEALPEMFQHLAPPTSLKPLFKPLFLRLVQMDAYISAAAEFYDEEEWLAILNGRASGAAAKENAENAAAESALPVCVAEDGDSTLSETLSLVTVLETCYPIILTAAGEMPIEEAFEALEPLFRNRTRNIQFVLFELARQRPREVFSGLLGRAVREGRVYGPFLCSLLARLRPAEDVRQRCFLALLRHIRAADPAKSTSLDSLVLVQGALYVLCFVREWLHAPGVREWVDEVVRSGVTAQLNRLVVERFCEVAGVALERSRQTQCAVRSDALEHFPFDWPVCPAVMDGRAADYNTFSE